MFNTGKGQIILNSIMIVYCVVFILFDFIVGQVFWAFFMIVLLGVFVYCLVKAVRRYREAVRSRKRSEEFAASYQRIYDEWKKR